MILRRTSGGENTGRRLSRPLTGSEATKIEKPPAAVGKTTGDTLQEEYPLFEGGGLPRWTA